MLIEQIEADFFGTNCWVFSTSRNSECFIVDPGIVLPNMKSRVDEYLRKHNLKPVAVVVTHGHLDHSFSVTPVADGYGIPALIHAKDAPALGNPFHLMMRGGPMESMLAQFGNPTFSEPAKIETLTDRMELNLAGMKLVAEVAPGHTVGSTIFTVDDTYLISGDVLFAGSIGRTDLPTGSSHEMRKTLKEKIVTLPEELIVLPGHGEQTTIARELKRNPYLTADFLNSTD